VGLINFKIKTMSAATNYASKQLKKTSSEPSKNGGCFVLIAFLMVILLVAFMILDSKLNI